MSIALLILTMLFGAVAALSTVALLSVHRRHHPRFVLPEEGPLDAELASLAGLTHGELTEGNRVELVQNGDGLLRAAGSLIDGAERSLCMETFLWRTGELSGWLVERLIERARAGVEVRLLLDGVGGRFMTDAERARLEQAGVAVGRLRPVRLNQLGWINNRTHRKILVADGRIGLVGGHCIEDRWLGDARRPAEVRDLSALLEGPVVRQVQAAFCENWTECMGEVPYGPAFFPRLEPAGDAVAHVAYVRPSGAVSAPKLLHHLAIRRANRRLWIQSPYFVPDDQARRALTRAAERGVDVRVMTSAYEVTDNRLVQRAGRHRLAPLAEAGVRIYFYRRSLLHQKAWTVDGEYALIGSVNFDERSFDLSDEISVAVCSSELARQLEEVFLADLAHCEPLEMERFARRPWTQKTVDAMAFLLREQL